MTNTHQHRAIALAAAALSVLALFAAPHANAWMWDTNNDKIDDRIAAVEAGGLNLAYDNANAATGRLVFAASRALGGDLRYGVYVGFDAAPTASQLAALRTAGASSTVFHPYTHIDYVRMELSFAEIQNVAAIDGVTRVESIPMMYPVNNVGTVTTGAKAIGFETFPNVREHLGLTGDGVVVSILDTGVNDEADPMSPYPGHEAFAGRFIAGGEFFAGDPNLNTGLDDSVNPIDRGEEAASNHGTHVGGTALGTGGPTELFGGIAPEASFVDQKVLSDAGLGFGSADGVAWAIHNKDRYGIQVLNLSLGTLDESDGTDASSQMINAAFEAGIISAIAMGNDGSTEYVSSPAAADFAFAIGSYDDMNTVSQDDDLISDFSNEGPRDDDGTGSVEPRLKPIVAAPGSGIISANGSLTTDGRQYKSLSGTSMATPMTAGVIALLLEANPALTPSDVMEILKHTSVHRNDWGKTDANASFFDGIDPNYHPSGGWGRLDAYAAAKEALFMAGDPASRVQVVAISAAPDIDGLEAIDVNWVSQREVGLSGYNVYRAPDVDGAPGAFTQIASGIPGIGSGTIEQTNNRNEYTHRDTGVSFGEIYWYQIEHVSASGTFQEPAYPVVLGEPRPVAVVRYSITHNAIDNDLLVTIGSGFTTQRTDFTTAGQSATEADTVEEELGDPALGNARHDFSVVLTSLDNVGDLLPPSAEQPWFLTVNEGGFVNRRGQVNSFEIDVYDAAGENIVETFVTGDMTPQQTVETQTVEMWIPSNPNTQSAGTAPVIAEADPAEMAQGSSGQAVAIYGAHFQPGATLSVSGEGVTVDSVETVSGAELAAVFSVAEGAQPGARDITVTNSLDGLQDTGEGIFNVILAGAGTTDPDTPDTPVATPAPAPASSGGGGGGGGALGGGLLIVLLLTGAARRRMH